MEGRGRRLGHAASWRKDRAASTAANGAPMAVDATPMEEAVPNQQQEEGEQDYLIRRCQEFIKEDKEVRDPIRQLIQATVSVIEDHAPKIIDSSTKQLQDELQALKAEMDAMTKTRQEDMLEIERLRLELKNVKEEHAKEQKRLKEVLTSLLHESN